jgi:hypothetical protein
MLTKPEIARLIDSKVNTTKCELVQFFHSNFYKERLSGEEYVNDFILFQTELDNYLKENKNWSINDTFLKDKPFTPSKIPVKVQKQLDLEYKELQDYIEKVSKEFKDYS